MLKTRQEYGPIGKLGAGPADLLVCFAVKEEARFFPPSRHLGCQAWMTGMGRRNAVEGIRRALALVRPKRVITAGFAGGLNPALKFGAVVYEQDFDAGFAARLEELGAVKAAFHCHRRVAITAAEKCALWKSTGADVVEMESSVIRNICREQKIPGATIRVISDDAGQDLPLDFNALMTPEDRINHAKLIWAVVSRPWRIPKLIEFQQDTVAASRRLGAVLGDLLRPARP
jgi:adenosylhomocysteine nucleosidase